MVRTDGGAIGFYPQQVASQLILRALRSGHPEDAIGWLQKILNTASATGKAIHVLWGAPVNEAFQLRRKSQ